MVHGLLKKYNFNRNIKIKTMKIFRRLIIVLYWFISVICHIFAIIFHVPYYIITGENLFLIGIQFILG